MSRLRNLEARLLDIIEMVYSVANEDDMVGAVFVALRELMPFSSGVFMPVNADTLELQAGTYFNCEPGGMAVYLAQYAALDPFVLRGPRPALLNQSVLLSEIISASELERSEFNSFMREVPYSRAAAIIVAVEAQPVGLFSVHRQHRDTEFSARERAMIDRIGRHLARAITLRHLAKNPVQHEQTGLLVFGVRGDTLYANTAALRHLGTTPSGVVLAALARHGPASITLASQSYRVSHVPWAAASLLRRFAVDEALSSVREATTIVALQPYRARTDASRRLMQHGLSTRQSAVAEAVCRGISNLEIALQLGISERTVKDHLVDVFRRLEIGSRTALIGKVFGSLREPPPRTTGEY